MRARTFLLQGITVTTLFSCGPVQSTVQGHYEYLSAEQTAEQTARYAHQQAIRPEYLPAEGVIIHASLLDNMGRGDIAQALLDSAIESLYIATNTSSSLSTLNTLRHVTGQIKILPPVKDSATVWARDWAPITAVGAAPGPMAKQTILLDFNYYPRRYGDDAVPSTVATTLKLPRVSVPVYNEGGNFMVNQQGHCMMSARVSEANSKREIPVDIVMDEHAISEQYKTWGGCTRVTIFPRLPGEGTGHIDMWAKFLDDNTVLVNRLDARSLGSSPSTLAIQVRDYLEMRAAEIADMGYQVVRIPMPRPLTRLTRSYTNSLIINGNALVPTYEARPISEYGFSTTDESAMIAEFENEVRKAYTDAGFIYRPIRSDDLISIGGAIHCVTMQVGQ